MSGPLLVSGASRVPILGQRFEVVGMLVSAVVLCKCDGGKALLITSNQVTACPSCRKGYVVQGLTWQAGEPPAFQVAIVAAEPDAAPPLT